MEGGALAFRYEVIFCLFLAALVFLWRDNPTLDYPQVLYALLALLAANLATGLCLRRRSAPPRSEAALSRDSARSPADWVLAAGVIANCAAVTAIVAYSGGTQSNLWMLYLMPVYTVCLFLSAREVAWVTAGVVSFIVAVHLAWAPAWDARLWFELCVKCAVLGSGAAAVWALASKERAGAARLSEERGRIGRLSAEVARQDVFLRSSERIADVGILSGGIVHDLRTPLTVILGTADILLEERLQRPDIERDLERIRRAARHCEAVLSRFMDFFHRQDLPMAPCDLRGILEAALAQRVDALAESGVCVVGKLPEGLPAVSVSPAHLERVFLNVLWTAAQSMPKGGELDISAEASPPGETPDWVTVRLQTRGAVPVEGSQDGIPGSELPMGLYLAREIMRKNGGGLSVCPTPEGEWKYLITLAAALTAPPSGPTL